MANITGYGATNNHIFKSSKERQAIMDMVDKLGVNATAKAFGVSVKPIKLIRWLETKSIDKKSETGYVLKPKTCKINNKTVVIDDAYRISACEHAIRIGNAVKAAEAYGVSFSTLYGWLKAYDMQNAYFNS